MRLSIRPMHVLRNTPIKRKLMIITMLTSGVAMMIACAAFLTYDLLALRGKIDLDLSTTAAIIGENSTAALSFNDPDSAKQTLNSLQTHPHILAAAIYNKDGKVFAQYQNPKFSGSFSAPRVEPDGRRADPESIRVFRRIDLAGERIGTIYLQSDQEEAQDRVNGYALIFVLVMLAASGAAFLLSNTLQAIISAPVSHLAEVVQRVASEKNYSVRAIKQSEDELGQLIDGFNEMLNQIQQRDSALREAQSELEKRVEERTKALAQSLAMQSATLESSTDGITAYGFQEGLVCYNAQFKAMWNIPEELLKKGCDAERIRWIAAQVKTPADFLEQHVARAAKQDAEAFEVLELKDGRMVERYLRPQMVDGKKVGVVISFRDITQRKHAEQELEKLNRQLLESSRQAGMAEVATGVLHNVGNVLNSVNVSANLLAESAKRSKVASLAKLAALLEQHKQDAGAFIAQDPRGKHLPQFLIELSQHLLSEQQGSIKELESLRSNIEHIKQIVNMQQAYSKVSGLKEVVNMVDLLEDALRLNGNGLQRHGVRVVRDFEETPALNTEKHKILQILVNLVRNAKYACSDSGREDKCVVLRVARSGDHIRISVSDNGVGIAPENLTRVFSHGFTTRKDGHGFGLHSGALSARELGGSLRAYSEGPGMGATFTLELPIEAARESECLSA